MWFELFGIESIKVLPIPSDYIGGATPVPIPNTVVKPSGADDTGDSRESRKLLGLFAHFQIHSFPSGSRDCGNALSRLSSHRAKAGCFFWGQIFLRDLRPKLSCRKSPREVTLLGFCF